MMNQSQTFFGVINMGWRAIVLVGITAAGALSINSDFAAGQDPVKPELARTELEYESTIVAAVNSKGVALIRLDGVKERANDTGNGILQASYQWRYMARSSNQE